MELGYKLFAEGHGPREIVEQAVRAEAAGFDFVEVSDHFHPWLPEHEHSGFAWSMLAAIAVRTTRLGLATGVTCPFIRYHPAVIAQAAATTAVLSEGRFTLGVGAGERLNEHVVGRGWPANPVRHAMLRESLEIIRLLWSGGYASYAGEHLSLEHARIFDLPDEPPRIAVAISGPASAQVAAELGDGIFATDPDPELPRRFAAAGGTGPRYAEVPLAWAPTEAEAVASAHRSFRFGALGWKVLPDLPDPEHFAAATAFVRPEDVAERFGAGPDVERHVEVARQFAEAGFDHLALVDAGPDPEGFFAFFERELGPRLRELAAAAPTPG